MNNVAVLLLARNGLQREVHVVGGRHVYSDLTVVQFTFCDGREFPDAKYVRALPSPADALRERRARLLGRRRRAASLRRRIP